MNVEINLWAVVLAAVTSMAVGFFWYSPMVLGKQWMALRGLTTESMEAKQKEAGQAYMISSLFGLLTAALLAHVMALSENFYHYPSLMTGVTSALSVWLGFVMPTQATATLFSDKKQWGLFGIDTGYQLVSLIVMGLVLGLF